MRTINCDSCGVKVENLVWGEIHTSVPVARNFNFDLCEVCGGKLMDKLASGEPLNLFPGAAIDPVKEGERPGL